MRAASTPDSAAAWLRLGAAVRAVHRRRRRHVVLCGGAAGRAGGVRRRPRRRLAALHADHDRLRLRRHRDGMARPTASACWCRCLCGAIALSLGYVATGYATTLWQFAIAQGLLIGVGSSATLGPLMADVSHWFVRRRGIAVTICSAGNSVAGTDLAADRAAFHRQRRRARDADRHRHVLRGHDDAGGADDAAPRAASGTCARSRTQRRRESRSARPVVGRTADIALRRRRRLLRGDVDAAGAYRRLLRRSRLRRRARRRNAGADDGARHRQPGRLRRSSPTGSAACRRC